MNHSTVQMMQRAAELRHKPTSAEIKLWTYQRAHRLEGVDFCCQHAIGPYIVDFCARVRN